MQRKNLSKISSLLDVQYERKKEKRKRKKKRKKERIIELTFGNVHQCKTEIDTGADLPKETFLYAKRLMYTKRDLRPEIIGHIRKEN